ncbi:hypothetical protein FHP25_27950 [Vineibacter terrae]|uniref:Lipoprotein n=1 Tax=Vineibacter terrae TaxID=2586908 RepID=A0A5C8PE26_9HYPH|nr:hypothetical protein [Vineibacter terrae]TXL71878.1 hypothetical protein FHP25_27950 [Vineibacter terrae]
MTTKLRFRNLRPAGLLVAASAAFLATSCDGEGAFFRPHRVVSQVEAGSSHIAVTAVMRFADVRQAMKPAFNLNAADARREVIPTTTYVEERVLDALSAALGIGLPQSTFTRSRRIETVDGQTKDSLVNEQSRTSGRPVQPKDPPGGLTDEQRKAATLASADDKRADRKDPMLEYAAATALYQEVKLLEQHVDHLATRKGYTPYIVRLNVGLQPFARNQPYDAYLSLAFFSARHAASAQTVPLACPPGAPAGAGRGSAWTVARPPYVVPLLVTDNLEASRAARTTELVRQISLAVSAIAQGVAIDTSFGRTRDELRSIVGDELNSVLSVARSVDNVIQVRFGAPRSPTSDYTMVPRNHAVSVLLLIPNEIATPAGQQVGLVRLFGKVSLRHATEGERLPFDRETIRQEARQLLARLLSPQEADDLVRNSEEFDRLVGLLASVQRQDVCAFDAIFAATPYRKRVSETVLWTALAELSVRSDYLSASFEVPPPASTAARSATR